MVNLIKEWLFVFSYCFVVEKSMIMLGTIIKYFCMSLCSFYIFKRLLQIKNSKKDTVTYTGIAVLVAIISYFFRLHCAPLSIFIFVCLLSIGALLIFRNPINLSVVTMVLSSGLSYFIFVIASVIAMPAGFLYILIKNGSKPSRLITFLIIGIIQCLLSTVPFHFSRLKNGMPFLRQYGDSDAGVFISASLLCVTPFFSLYTENDIYAAIPIFFIILCGLSLFFWWKKRLSRRYIENLKGNEIAELKKRVSEQQSQIEKLAHHNEELAKIIHKDNKLLPAMEIAVRDLLYTASSERNEYTERASGLLEQINILFDARNSSLQVYEYTSKSLPKTGILSTDGVIRYLQQRAKDSGITFEFSISGSVKYLADQIISETDLNTLIADLGENALIATSSQAVKRILLSINIYNSNYQIDVFDSGDIFSAEVLYNLGHRNFTTHEATGGSGIGLMNTWSLMEKYRASFELDETIAYLSFTKKVSICFDGKREYRIRSHRSALKNICAGRNDIQFL